MKIKGQIQRQRSVTFAVSWLNCCVWDLNESTLVGMHYKQAMERHVEQTLCLNRTRCSSSDELEKAAILLWVGLIPSVTEENQLQLWALAKQLSSCASQGQA